MNITVSTKKLDATNLQKLLRCDPSRIVAEEATPEAIETCRMMGVELLLSPGAGTRVERPIVDIGYAGEGLVHMGDIENAAHTLYEAGRKLGLGVRVVLATSDMSGLKNASPEEAEQILANAAIKIRLDISKQGDAAHTADPVSTGDGVGSPFYVMLDDFAFFPPPGKDLGFMGEHRGTSKPVRHVAVEFLNDAALEKLLPFTTAYCLIVDASSATVDALKKCHGAGMLVNVLGAEMSKSIGFPYWAFVDPSRPLSERELILCVDHVKEEEPPVGEQVTTTFHDNRVFSTLGKRLKSAGYIPGQTYEQCRNMALWHPGMAHVMESVSDEGLFGLVTGCIAQSDLLHHEVVLGKSHDGMKDALSSFASDLHEVFRKHEMLVAVGRAEGVQLAVSRKLLDLLGQHEGAEGYLGNLHII